MPLAIESLRKDIEREFIGFSPSTASVKPVHIANGLFRAILGFTVSTSKLNRFVISQTQQGVVPRRHDLATVYNALSEEARLDAREVAQADVERLRPLLRRVVAADNAVFTGGMESYSAGNVFFVSNDRIAQDGGELVAEWLRRRGSALSRELLATLQQSGDAISILCAPLLDENKRVHEPAFDYANVRFLNQQLPPHTGYLWNELANAADTLAIHLEEHPNKLLGLRIAVHFASFVLVRHLANLEAYYVPGQSDRVPPFLLDFSTDSGGPIATASWTTYNRTCQSIARFFAWAFGEQLKKYVSEEDLSVEPAPTYKVGDRTGTAEISSNKRKERKEAEEIWSLARQRARTAEDAFTVFGEATYDMMALQAEGDPVKYLRKLGLLIGLLYPPNQSARRFSVKQDLLEMFVRGAIEPGETVDMATLQERFWQRYRVVVGGPVKDEERLLNAGVYQVDSKALDENQERFASALGRLDFARLLADGVLQVEVGASHAS